ncbi:hypothetical protein CIB84_017676 [Bambusicola thoracicus]|uniref:Uncharacterized protein n=1 Tax=Bambusicola thoracicus TaxID=9083 RepID=A0A2P4S397_BAMTH|nr:hypothetical protein CIB84_017676 [Bambusicola thoracicus]
MITFLQMHGKDICRQFDLPVTIYILRSCMSSLQHSTLMPFLCQAVAILTCCHPDVTIDSFFHSETCRRIREFSLQWCSREKKEKKGREEKRGERREKEKGKEKDR